jgi:hypothetical protein
MANEELLRAIGTLHCPHCHMPMFANTLHPRPSEVAHRGEFVAPFILIVDDAFRRSAALIAVAERLDLWSPSAVVGREGAGYGESRTNDFLLLSPQLDPSLEPWEGVVRELFHNAAHGYVQAVGHLELRSDLGYHLLRYRTGEQFTEHVDTMPGATVYGQRQLTAMLYLNDDFEGGELVLPHQGLVYKPRAGALVLFPSGFCFPHASHPVTRGTKYSLVTWFI